MKSFMYSTVIFISLLPLLNYLGYHLHTKETMFGQCVGLTGLKEGHLVYEISKKNVLITTIFLESIIAPAIVISSHLYCPIGIK